ncbi:related to SRP40 - serine-rich protein with a role in pre-ribosome assembly or transport [Ustilago trichophora]|uniref:Related to SRP40 - serine-rich protein with a role in pre-ribosome assembly or transport n=1 Tax=Ustilago trichophora TaxID=86804 RepID=A0A5C3ER49_9BASI|nr:related to SRP40 - serine-rich protein with a role in pre-ribosome assembly or transport [Ustilago trichophora]SPO32445.1 related to SRP40 - serine-rich protein with a role in pre-ribosome assembly or transport [Ustilago trichophora]
MPLRRHATSRRSASWTQPITPNTRTTNPDPSATTTRDFRTNAATPSPNASGRATLGDLLSSSHNLRAAKAARHVIGLSDSNDDDDDDDNVDAPSATRVQTQRPINQPESDDVVTPELPPADASAPALPDTLADLSDSLHLPSVEVVIEDDSGVETTELQLDVPQNKQPLHPPEPPPDPLANQRPIIDCEELDMQINELMTRLDAKQTSDSEHDDEDYEERRQRKLRENDVLLAMLGLAPSGSKPNPYDSATADFQDEHDHDADDEQMQNDASASRRRGRPKRHLHDDSARPSDGVNDTRSYKKKKYDRKVKFADDGTTKMAPLPGESFDLAYVDISALRDRARNDYVFIRDVPDIRPEDLITWSEDEEEAEEEEQEAGKANQYVSDEDPDDAGFRGYDALGRRITKRKYRQPDVLPDGTVFTSCHQCRRKTPGTKMRCHLMRQGDACKLWYCERCITIRYGIDFDPDNSNFQCPRCLGYCNCSLCLRRSGFGDVVRSGMHRVLAVTQELKRLASQKALDGVDDAIGAIVAEPAAIETEAPTPKKRGRPKGKANGKEAGDLDTPVFGPQKRRGRPPKEAKGGDNWKPDKLELNLSDEVAEGEVLSELEGYTLGRLNVARRVLKLIASKRAAAEARKAKLIVRLKIPSRTLTSVEGSAAATDGGEHKRKMANYHDMEKDVWVRSAADYSTSESDVDSYSEHDELADDVTDAEAEDVDEAVFEEGRTQVFAASYLQRTGIASTVASRGSSPLTSLDGSESNFSMASSHYDAQDKDASQEAEIQEGPEASTEANLTAILPQTSLSVPQDMQQLALAVLKDPNGASKAVHADILRLGDSPAFPTSSGSEAGQLAALLDPEPLAGTPVFYAESALSGP